MANVVGVGVVFVIMDETWLTPWDLLRLWIFGPCSAHLPRRKVILDLVRPA